MKDMIYLDNAATTRISEEALSAMETVFRTDYGNPSSLHRMGMEAENHMKAAADTVAKALHADPKEILFTSGGTESNNLALFGAARSNRRFGKKILTSAIEHPSVSNAVAALEEEGFDVVRLPVDPEGKLDLSALSAAADEETILFSLMHVNNEIGTIQPLSEAVKIIREKCPHAFVHVDAVQSCGKLPLDPKKTVSQAISEPIRINKILRNKRDIEDRVMELMETVGLAERLVNTYPHELDGGRRQRIGIARALAMEPKLIICDEPVSALDVSIQAQILNLMDDLQERLDLTYIFITHDLAVVNHFADEIAVMYLGSIVEKAPSEELFENPIHPYTRALLSAIPIPDLDQIRERISLKGEITSPVNLPNECRFANRCYECQDKICRAGIPPLVEVSPNHFVACSMHTQL